MRKILTRILTTIGAMVLLQATVLAIVWFTGRRTVEDHTIVELSVEKPFVEHAPDDAIGELLFGSRLTLRDVLDGLEQAATDTRVSALVVRVGSGAMGLGQIQELREAIATFRTSGKPAVAYAESFGEFGPGNGSYYLATAFDAVYLQPSGDVGITGLIAESPFLRGTLDKLGIVPQLDHRGEYKSAMNLFTETHFTDAHREATTRVMDSQFGQIVRGIAEARKLDEQVVRGLMDRAPLSSDEALKAGLVDGLEYRDQVYARLEETAGKDAPRLGLAQYLARVGTPETDGEMVALIYGVGGVGRGKSSTDPISGETTMGADTVTAAFREAVEDEAVKAILFRIDSPGGSYVASDTIWREVGRARAAGKPVVVSMANVAGSGGYFVAIPADRIIAQPGTITGSIGVLGGKMVMTGLWDKIGLTWDGVHTSRNGTMWSSVHKFTPTEWGRFEEFLDRVYADFTTKVAEGRKLPKEKVLEIAQGRIWTGEDAKALGLVDELGGYPVALRAVRELVGLGPDAPLHLEPFPPRKPLLTQLVQRVMKRGGSQPDEGDEEPSAVLAQRLVEASAPLVQAVRALGLGAERGVLAMPEVASPQ